MWAGLHRLTPEVGGAFKAAVEAEAQRIFRERRKNGEREPLEAYAAEALANLVLGKTTTQGVKYTVHILSTTRRLCAASSWTVKCARSRELVRST